MSEGFKETPDALRYLCGCAGVKNCTTSGQ